VGQIGAEEITMRRRRTDVSIWVQCFGLFAILVVFFYLSDGEPRPAVASGDAAQATVLSNGLTVISRSRAGNGTVSVAVGVRAGVRDESPDFWGGAHWLEHLLFLGSERYPASEALFGAISDLGGQIDAFTGAETTTYAATAPAPALTSVLDVLADMIIYPRFPSDEVERERRTVLTEIEREGLSAGITADLASIETLLEHLAGRVALPVGGTSDSVEALRLEDAIAFKARHYVARNMVVGVVGPMPHDEVVAAVAQRFAALPSGERLVTPVPPPQESLRLTGPGSRALVGQRIPGLNSPDAAAMRVLDAVLDGPGTRMRDAISDGETTRGGGTIYWLFSDVGVWIAHGAGNTDEVVTIVQDQIRRLQEELVSEEELRTATRYLAGRVLIANELGIDQVVRMVELSLFDMYESEQDEANRILSVSADHIRRVARTYFDPDTFSVMRPTRNNSAVV
jgi:predicted Zn-dependent peptidase